MTRRRTPPRTFCPACDAPIERTDATGPDRCASCGISLIPVVLAPHGRRLAAAAIDAGILWLVGGSLNWALLKLVGVPPLLGNARGLPALLRLFELDPWVVLGRMTPLLVMSCLYLGLFWSLTGRTVGGRSVGVRVVDERGRPPALGWTAVRLFVHFAGGFAGALGWIWAFFDRERRAWHDRAARTYVVRET